MRTPTARQSVLIVLLAIFTFVALIVGLPEMVARLYPEHESWARDRIPKLVPVLGLLLVLVAGVLTNRSFKNYTAGEDPLAMARVMDAFGRRRKAIRYLESVPRDHPRAEQVQIQLARFRQDS
jgi:hypothetical protein